MLVRMSRIGAASDAVRRAMRALAGFVSALKVGYGDVSMIYSPAHGDTAFTVPLFDAYLRRVVPFPEP